MLPWEPYTLPSAVLRDPVPHPAALVPSLQGQCSVPESISPLPAPGTAKCFFRLGTYARDAVGADGGTEQGGYMSGEVLPASPVLCVAEP